MLPPGLSHSPCGGICNNVWKDIHHLYLPPHGRLVQKPLTRLFIALGQCYGELLSNACNTETGTTPWQTLNETLPEINKHDSAMQQPYKSIYIVLHYLRAFRNANFEVIHSFLRLIDQHCYERRNTITSGLLNNCDKSVAREILSFSMAPIDINALPSHVTAPDIM